MTIKDHLPELIKAKLYRPIVTSDYVPRPRLLETIDRQRHRPLILVSAPAGYGKTTLLSAWLETCGWPSAWLSLNHRDSDLIGFAAYFVAAVQTRFPHIGRETQSLLHAQTVPPVRIVADRLVNELDDLSEPFILVLDDYHTIRAPAVHALLTELLHYPPRLFHLVVSTRYDPPLPLSKLRANDQIAEVRTQDLRFSLEDATEFVQRIAGAEVDRAIAALIEEKTEGWAAGLRLASLSLRGSHGADQELEQLIANEQNVSDYFFHEVLEHQPRDIRNFLLQTSILDRLSGSLCNAVMGLDVGADDPGGVGQAYLERLEKMNLFMSALDEERQWYRYHHLFRDLLQHELKRHSTPEKVAELHRRASVGYMKCGLMEEALHHALTAGDMATATQIVARHRHTLINDEQWVRLDRWVRHFPRQVVEVNLELLVTSAWIAWHRFQVKDLQRILECAETLMARPPAVSELSDPLRGEIAFLRSWLFFWNSDAASSIACARQALEMIPHDRHYMRVVAWLIFSGNYITAGDAKTAIETMLNGLNELRDQGLACRAHLLAAICYVYFWSTSYSALEQTTTQLFALASGLDTTQSLNWGRYFQGVVHYHRNELAEAENLLSAVISHRYECQMACLCHSAFALALTYQAQQRPDEARRIIDLTAAYLLEIGNSYLLPILRIFEAQLALQQGNRVEAANRVDQFAISPNSGVLPPMHLFYVPFMTVVKVRLAQGTVDSRQEAAELLARLRRHAESECNVRVLVEVFALQALLEDELHHAEAALAALENAVTLAQPHGFIRLFADLGPRLGYLLNQLRGRGGGVAPGYLERILAVIAEAKSAVPVRSVNQKGLIDPLTSRELEVLVCLEQRLSDKEIANRLTISSGTVKRHTHSIFQKLYVNSRREAVAKATALGILPLR